MFARIEIDGFRNVREVCLDLKPVNVLVGPNGCGKTNLFRAVDFAARFLAESDRARPPGRLPPLASVIEEFGGPDLAPWNGKAPATLRFAADAADGATSARLAWEARIPPPDRFPAEAVVIEERLVVRHPGGEATVVRHGDRPGAERWWAGQPDGPPVGGHEAGADAYRLGAPNLVAAALAGLPLSVVPGDLRDLAAAAAGPLVGELAAARLVRFPELLAGLAVDSVPVLHDVRELSGADGDLVNLIRNIEQTPEGLADLVELLRDLLPDLRRIWVREVEGRRWLQLAVGDRSLSLRHLSDGTLQALVLATLLVSPWHRGRLLLLDEPELSLHPAWLAAVGRWLVRPPGAQQLLVATHSPDLLDAFTDEFRAGRVAVFAFGADERPTVTEVRPDALRERLDQGWQLGDLYRVGDPSIAGWPW